MEPVMWVCRQQDDLVKANLIFWKEHWNRYCEGFFCLSAWQTAGEEDQVFPLRGNWNRLL